MAGGVLNSINKPPVYADTSDWVFKKWLEDVFTEFIKNSEPNETVDTNGTRLGLNFFYGIDATSGNVSVTLPPAANAKNKKYIIKKLDASANHAIVAAVGSDLIDGSTTLTLANQWDAALIQSDGFENWYILAGGGGGGGGGISGITVEDEGVVVGTPAGINTINFVGQLVTATGVGALATVTINNDTLIVQASEDLSQGDLVNVFNSGGSARARKAKASAAGFEAYGWTDSAVVSGSNVTIRFTGKNTHSSGLSPGPVFLSDTAGLATSTCPSGSGHVAQQVGVAESATSFAFEWQPAVLLAALHTVGVVNGGYLKTITFTSSGTLNIPTAVTGGWLTAVGGGGGGGGSRTSSNGGGGGGAAEAVVMQPIEVVSGAAYSVTIGAKGTGGASGSAGTDGGDTILAAVQTWTVKGGKGGTSTGGSGAGGNGGGIGGSTGASAGFAGGNGSIESIAFYGGASGGGGSNVNTGGGGAGGGAGGYLAVSGGSTSSSQGGGGSGANTIWGLGGAGGNGGSNGSSSLSTAYGAGGGGAGGSSGAGNAGGDGTAGYLMFMYVG